MSFYNKRIGDLGEKLAQKYITKLGYKILDINYRCKMGEIDIIGRDEDFICFIEVKTRSSYSYGSPGEAVNFIKQHRICKTAEMYILKKKLHKFNFRFDVIEVILKSESNDFSIRLIKDAFQP